MRKALACLALMALTGCSMLGGSSPKTHYYALSAISPSGSGRTARLAHPITISAVHIPESLDRHEMVLRSSDNSVDISGTDRWTGPLGPMTRRVLSEDLAARLPQADVIMPGAPAPDGTRQIVVTIARFGPQASGRVVLDANWSAIDPQSGKPTLRRDVNLQENPSGNGADAVASAMSRLLARLAGQMAQALAAG